MQTCIFPGKYNTRPIFGALQYFSAKFNREKVNRFFLKLHDVSYTRDKQYDFAITLEEKSNVQVFKEVFNLNVQRKVGKTIFFNILFP